MSSIDVTKLMEISEQVVYSHQSAIVLTFLPKCSKPFGINYQNYEPKEAALIAFAIISNLHDVGVLGESEAIAKVLLEIASFVNQEPMVRESVNGINPPW